MSAYRFRAWDSANNKMIYNAAIQNGQYVDRETGRTHPYPIMQSTGIKDVNGKEIYERDVVIKKGSKRKIRADVAITPDGVYMFADNDQVYDFREFVNSELVVIGNVYEKPWIIKRGDDV